MIQIFKSKKISTILVSYSIVVLLVLNIIAAVIMSLIVGSSMSTMQNNYFMQSLSSATTEIEQFMVTYTRVGELIANNHSVRNLVGNSTMENPMFMSSQFNDVISFLDETRKGDDLILSIGLGSVAEDAIYSDEGKRYEGLSSKEYYEAVTKNITHISEPYVDTATNEFCISITIPIKYNNISVGLMCLSISLDGICSFIEDMSFGETGNMVLFSKNNSIMAYDDLSKIGKGIDSTGIKGEQFTKELSNPTGKLIRYKINESEKTVGMLHAIPYYDWKLLVGISQSEYNSSTFSSIVYLIIMLLIIAIILCIFIRSIVVKKLKPITNIQNALEEMSKGNLHVQLNHNSNDEIGEISDSINKCISVLSSYVSAIDNLMGQLKDGKLKLPEQTVDFSGDFKPIQESIYSFADKLTDLIKNISNSAESVNYGSEHVSSGAQVLAQGSAEQASSIEELLSRINDISMKIGETASDTQTAQNQVDSTYESLNQSNQHMNELVTVMSKISGDSTRIHSIIKTIEDIAFQTNILALNAAVEAARAGQAGKGFAVVADEVRNLSSKSTEAANQIAQLIENSVRSIKQGEEATQKTTVALSKTVEQAAVVGEIIDRIAAAAVKQSDSVKAINQSMDQISGVVQNNSATAEESAAASKELSNQSHILKSLINHFKV